MRLKLVFFILTFAIGLPLATYYSLSSDLNQDETREIRSEMTEDVEEQYSGQSREIDEDEEPNDLQLPSIPELVEEINRIKQTLVDMTNVLVRIQKNEDVNAQKTEYQVPIQMDEEKREEVKEEEKQDEKKIIEEILEQGKIEEEEEEEEEEVRGEVVEQEPNQEMTNQKINEIEIEEETKEDVGEEIQEIEEIKKEEEEKIEEQKEEEIETEQEEEFKELSRPQTLQEKYPNILLPTLILAGFPKAGTTSVASYLVHHPQVAFKNSTLRIDFNKEPNFLGLKRMTESEYINIFPDCNVENCTNKISFDGSIAMSSLKQGHLDCHHYYPDAKIVFVVRNPVERAYSRFRMEYKKGHVKSLNPDHFEEILNQTMPEFERIIQDFENRKKTNPPLNIWEYSNLGNEFERFIGGSLYYYHIEPFLKYYPKSRVHIVSTYQLETNPEMEVGKLFKFAGLESQSLNWEALKRNSNPPNEDMSPRIRERLTKFFQKHNKMLEDEFGESFYLDYY